MNQIQSDHFEKAILFTLQETFESVNGFYLDKGTSLFETLAEITAQEASIPVGGRCATLAAQVKHISLYLEALERGVREQKFPQVDWNEIWETVSAVTDDEWKATVEECQKAYQLIVQLVKETPNWPSEREIGGAIAIIAHTAYHLGEIRQALCTIKG